MSRWSSREAMQERILETAGRLFYGQGIRAVGVDTVAAEIGISKRTLYNYYPSKDDLIVAYLSRHFVQSKSSDRPLLEQILRYFDWLERWFATDTFRGCPFVNAVAELGDATHPAAKLAVAFKEQRRIWLRDALTQMKVADPDVLATQVAILAEGAIIAALVRGDPTVARAAKAAVRVLLTAAGVPDSDALPEPERRTGRARSRKTPARDAEPTARNAAPKTRTRR
jgi:AcrR family transcriptional regulator